MAMRCCKDSVAAFVANRHAANIDLMDGQRVECRWCVDGYGLYKDGVWSFHDQGFAANEFLARETSPNAVAERQAFLMDYRGKKLRKAMEE